MTTIPGETIARETAADEGQPQLPPAIRTLLAGLRRRIRRYVWLEGLATGVAWLGIAFWLSLAVDWFFEPSVLVRKLILAAVLLVFVGVILRLIVRRAFVHFSQGNLAMVLERRFNHLDDSLLTAVVLTAGGTGGADGTRADGSGTRADGSGSVSGPCNPQMLAHTCREAAQKIKDIRLGEVFNPGPLRWSVWSAVLLMASVGLFACQAPESLRIWARRSLMFCDEFWPRKVSLSVEGFKDGMEKVARGADLEVVALADTNKEVPATVQVRYRAEGGARGRATMNRLGVARKGVDPFQQYSYTFQGLLAPIRFDVVGGDDRVSGLQIKVVESPAVVETMLDCRYPAYMAQAGQTRPGSGAVELPRGTQVTVRCVANKDLRRVQIDSLVGQQSLPAKVLEAEDLAGDPRRFRHTVESLDQDTTLLFTLSDTDGITGRDPLRLVLLAKADQTPQLAVQLDGIGTAITPQARLPAVGSVSDDYGIARVWFEYAVQQQDDSTQQEPAAQPISFPAGAAAGLPNGALPSHPTELRLDAAMEVGDLKLRKGQRLLVCVKAADSYDLDGGPNVGTSERWLLDVVTPEDLLLSLEKREILLRQRFERIVQEVTETRDLLLRVDFNTATPGQGSDKGDSQPEAGAGKTPDGAKPDDEPGAEGTLSGQPQAPADKQPVALLRVLQVERALQNSQKNAQEVLGVAEAFDDIRKQTVNNRIDTKELTIRLKEGIADPLHRIAAEMFPELQRRLEKLQPLLSDEKLGPQQRELARQQADDILNEMRQVLGRMIELESFNEVVELLRTIIQLQKDLGKQTIERHKHKVSELLED